MRIDRNYNAVVETDREKEIVGEAIHQCILGKRAALMEAESCGETGDAETLEAEIYALYDILDTIGGAIKRGRSWEK